MTLRASLSENVRDSNFWIGLTPDGKDIPITTLHSSGGSSDILKIYIFNDGKRDFDGDETYDYVYKNVKFKPVGKRTRILTNSGSGIETTMTTIPVEDASYYNAGTKLLNDPINGNLREELWVRSVLGNNLVVDRGKNNTAPLVLPNETWLEAKTDHVFLSTTAQDGSWVNGAALILPNITEEWTPISFYLKTSTGALKTQIKIDTFFSILAEEHPKY